MMNAFDWRRLTDAGTVAYRLDANGRIYLAGDGAAAPFETAHVRDGRGGFVEAPLASIGLSWFPAGGQSWELRTRGAPTTMAHVSARWGEVVDAIAIPAGVDPRFVLTTIACEAGNPAPDADGFVKAPRTEKGYPGRTGESDPGDEARDAEDWRANGGQHSSHGLMQTLIGTAVAARPDLFAGRDPSQYREVLWRPENSIAAGVAYLAHFNASLSADPVALRFAYGAGSVRPSSSNRWGAVLYDEIVPLKFVAFWNDLACVLAGACVVAGPSASPVAATERVWMTLGLSLLAMSAAASVAAVLYTKRMALA
jgi:hypothetical protein